MAGGVTDGQGADTPTGGAHNVWDFLIVAFVIGALVVITIFLVKHFAKPSRSVDPRHRRPGVRRGVRRNPRLRDRKYDR